MIKRYFFIASVPHESESGEWMMADEVNDELNRLRAALAEKDALIERLRMALERIATKTLEGK